MFFWVKMLMWQNQGEYWASASMWGFCLRFLLGAWCWTKELAAKSLFMQWVYCIWREPTASWGNHQGMGPVERRVVSCLLFTSTTAVHSGCKRGLGSWGSTWCENAASLADTALGRIASVQWWWWWTPEDGTFHHWSDQVAHLVLAPEGGQDCWECLLVEDAGKAEVLFFMSVFSRAVCSLTVPSGNRGNGFFNSSSKNIFWCGGTCFLIHLITEWMHDLSNILHAEYKCISQHWVMYIHTPQNLPSIIFSLLNLKALFYSKYCYRLSLFYPSCSWDSDGVNGLLTISQRQTE